MHDDKIKTEGFDLCLRRLIYKIAKIDESGSTMPEPQRVDDEGFLRLTIQRRLAPADPGVEKQIIGLWIWRSCGARTETGGNLFYR